MHVLCARVYKCTLVSKPDTWERRRRQKCLTCQSQAPYAVVLRRRRKNPECFHPLNEEGLHVGVWSAQRTEQWFERENKKNENSGEKQSASLCLTFLRLRVKPPSRDFIVISSVRWPVPREVITLNRLTSDKDPGSYRCLHACSSYSWLTPVGGCFQVCEPDYWCRIKLNTFEVFGH